MEYEPGIVGLVALLIRLEDEDRGGLPPGTYLTPSGDQVIL